MPDSLKAYHSVSAELSVYNDLLMRGSRIVIPPTLRRDMLERLHEGHQGITKSKAINVVAKTWQTAGNSSEQLSCMLSTTCPVS